MSRIGQILPEQRKKRYCSTIPNCSVLPPISSRKRLPVFTGAVDTVVGAAEDLLYKLNCFYS